MDEKTVRCPDCGSPLRGKLVFSLDDSSSVDSVGFGCAGPCKEQYEKKNGIKLLSGVPKYQMRIIDIVADTLHDEHASGRMPGIMPYVHKPEEEVVLKALQ